MKKYKAEKTTRIIRTLESLQHIEDKTLNQVTTVINEKVEFYDNALKSWDKPHESCNSLEDINVGRKCCNAALDMADSIVNELRILYIQ